MPRLDATDMAAVKSTDGPVTIGNHDNVDVFVGIDVGKDEHHAVALNRAGKILFDTPLSNDETKMRGVLQKLKQHGTVLVIVDQPVTIGALPIAVARAESVLAGYLPGLAMRRIADLHAGKQRPMREMPRSLRRPPGLCPTRCALSKSQTNLWQSSRCCVALTMMSWDGRSWQATTPHRT